MGSGATPFNFVSLESSLFAEEQFIHQSRRRDKEPGHWLRKSYEVVGAHECCLLVSSARSVKWKARSPPESEDGAGGSLEVRGEKRRCEVIRKVREGMGGWSRGEVLV